MNCLLIYTQDDQGQDNQLKLRRGGLLCSLPPDEAAGMQTFPRRSVRYTTKEPPAVLSPQVESISGEQRDTKHLSQAFRETACESRPQAQVGER